MKIEVFVTNYARFPQARSLLDTFTGLGYDTWLLNCESPNDPPFEATDRIIKLPNVCYSGQWNEALRRATGDVLFVINSDVAVPDPARLMQRMESCYETHPATAVYAPDLAWTPWVYDRSLLPGLGDDLHMVPSTDSTAWSLRTDLARQVGEVPLEENRLGWGIEILAAYLANREGGLVVRDYAVQVRHPQVTLYNRNEADRQFRSWIARKPFARAFWDHYHSRDRYGFVH